MSGMEICRPIAFRHAHGNQKFGVCSTLLAILVVLLLFGTHASAFGPGDRLKAISTAYIRTGPGTSYATADTAFSGDLGVIISGPYYDGTYYWYSNHWDSHFSGYSASLNLNAIAPAAPILIFPGNTSSSSPNIITNFTPTFSWYPSTGATNYGLYIRDATSGSIIYSNDYIRNRTSLTGSPSQGFTPGHSYKWNMTASDSAGFSSASGLLYFLFVPPATNIVTLNAGSITATSAVLNCSFYPAGTTAYAYFQFGTTSAYGTTFGEANITTSLSSQWFLWATNNNLSPNTTYHYQVVVINNGGTYYGNDSYFTTLDSVPVAPSNLVASNASTGISLTWQDNSASESGFRIQRRQGSTYAYFSVGANQTNYTDTSAVQSMDYCYAISATNSSGASAQTSEQCDTYTMPGSPPLAIIVGNLTPVTGNTTYYGSYSTGSGLSYLWVTSKGQSSTASNPSFAFNSPGQNWIYLTVTDSSHRTSPASISINVRASNAGNSMGNDVGADPVVLSTGNYIQNHVDLELPGKGFPFAFRRFYNSKFSDQTGKPLGFGWTCNYNVRVQDAGTNVLVIQGDGSTWSFLSTNGIYVGELGLYDTLTKTNGDWLLSDKSQTVTRFVGTNGQLLSITDKNGNVLTCSYAGGVLSAITNSAGRVVTFDTNSLGCIASMTDQAGRTIQFFYDSNTNLITVIDANGNVTTNRYNQNHQITDAFDARSNRYVHNDYDTNTLVVNQQCDAFTNWTYFVYDFTNRITIQTNVLGKASVYYFDDRLLETNMLDEAGNRQVFGYDTNCNRILVQDKNGRQTLYGYDAFGNVTNKTDAANNVTSIAYDARNNPLRRVDALGNATLFGYDANGNLTTTTNAISLASRVQYDGSGLPTILTDPRGFSSTNQYDGSGNLAASIDAKGAMTRYEYDSVGRKIRQIDALNRTNSFFYDNNNNLLYMVDSLGFTNSGSYDANNNRIAITNPRNAATTNVFDLKDRLVSSADALANIFSSSYDPLDRKVSVTDALGHTAYFAFDDIGNLVATTNALNQVVHFTFDPVGNQTSMIDPINNSVTNYFDVLNRKILTIDSLNHSNATAYDVLSRVTATTNGDGQLTQYFYDPIGRLTNVVDSAGKPVFFGYDENGNRVRIIDPNGHTWTNVVDELNRVKEQDDPQGHKTFFSYDPVGNLTNKITANGDSISYGYDALNRLTTIGYPTGPPVMFGYDSVGNRTNMTDGAGVTTWRFDLLNRLTSITDPYGQTIANGYDQNGNRANLTYPGNKVVQYGFDALNRMTALTNWLGGIVSYAYDSRGSLVGSTNANGTTVAMGYDNADRLVTLANIRADASIIASYALTLDAVGNHTQATHTQPLFPILPNQTNTYSYDADNRLLTIDSQTVTHNGNGDLTGIGTNSFVFDFEDRLLQCTLTNGTGTFTYDGIGNRLARTVNVVGRRFVLDRMGALTQVLIETDTNNAPLAYYIYGLGLAERISADGKVATYHYNIQGSTVAITDSGGNITDSYAYDSFGVLANSDGDSPQPFRYLGRYGIVDDSTGLLYARARYFNPQLGRFITKDPVTGKDSDGQSLNRYIYALNNPLRFVDPTGLSAHEGHYNSYSYNPYAAEAAYWQAYYDSASWMIPYLTFFKYSGDAAQIGLAFVSGGESVAVQRGVEGAVQGGIKKFTASTLGRQGEAAIQEATGLSKNTETFIVNGRARIPDFVVKRELVSDIPTQLIESKNVQYQSLTSQLRDYADLVGPGGRIDVALPTWARVSKPLQNAFDDPANPLFRMDLNF
jgi:RHS repeat-associated protein